MRFEVRFSNGFWKVFDTFRYRSAGMFGLKTLATEALPGFEAEAKQRQQESRGTR